MRATRDYLEAFSCVIITGASSGIGAQFVRSLHHLAPHLRFHNLSRSAPDPSIATARMRHWPCDLALADQRAQVVAQLLATEQTESGKVLLINNSGFGSCGYFDQLDRSNELDMLEVNCRAVVDLTHRLLAEVIRRGGAIINVASTAAWQPTPYLSTYGASKAFLLHWSLSLNEELRRHAVPVMALCPGPTESDFFRRAGYTESPAAGIGQTAHAVVLFALRKLPARAACPISGKLNCLLAGMASKLPKALAARISGKVLARYRLRTTARATP